MKNIIVKALIVMSLISCKESPNYNPFDEQFDVSVKKLIDDNCDTISAGCGYFNLIKRDGKLRPYYQVYIDDFDQVVAKGFTLEIDTFVESDLNNLRSYKWKVDSILSLPLDREELNQEFGVFGYTISSIEKGEIQIVNPRKIDTVHLELNVYPIDESFRLIREVGYFKLRDP